MTAQALTLHTSRAAVPPTAEKRRRITGIDAARGIALIGMIAVHTLDDSDAAGHPTWSATIFTGRAAAAFAVLSGVSIAILTGRKRVTLKAAGPTAAGLAVRALAIGAIGLALGHTDAATATVILPYYAIMFLLAIPLVFLPTWAVSITGVAIAAGMPALSHILLTHLPEAAHPNLTFGWLFTHPRDALTELAITGEYPALPWLAYLCAGIAIGRLRLTRTRTILALLTTGLVFMMTAAVIASHLALPALQHIWTAQAGSTLTEYETSDLLTFGGDGTTPTSTWWWLAIASPHTSTPLDLLATTGSAIALLGVTLLAGQLTGTVPRRLASVIQTPLAAAGSVTLSLYTAHILFINSEYDTNEATTSFILQVIAVLLIGLAIRATIGRGPLEAAVTTLSTRTRRWAARRPPTATLANHPRATRRDQPIVRSEA